MNARKMKDSGIEWIGEIPEEWIVCKIKYLATMKSGESIGASEIANDGQYPVYGGNGLRGYTSAYTHDGKYILIGRQGALCGNVRSVEGKFWATEHAVVVYEYDNIDIHWFKYSLDAMNLNQYSTSAAQPGLSVEQITNILACVPPFSEQKAIAGYLDEKCAAIDQVVASKQKQNEQLAEYRQSLITEAVTKGLNPSVPMKNSGIEWIGEIPEEWQVLPLKYLLKYPLQYGATETGEDYVDGYPRYIRITDIDSNNKLKEENQRYLNFKDASPFILNDGDILFARSGATVGKTFLYLSEYGKAAFAGYLVRASVNTDVAFSKFIYYYTFSYCYEYWKNMIFSQATIQNIGADKYSIIDVPQPPLAEQKAIAAYLDKKCGDIDALRERNKKIIDSLQEYKQSLIYEAVTGKIEL